MTRPPKDFYTLGLAYAQRYYHAQQQEDLEHSITYHERGLEIDTLSSTGHSKRPIALTNLAAVLFSRYQQHGQMEDLDKSISCSEEALNLVLGSHSTRPLALTNLGIALLIRHEQFGKMEDLEKSITCSEQALNLLPFWHPSRATSLSNFGMGLLTKYQQLGKMEDLEKSIACSEQALRVFSTGHPLKPISLGNLGIALLTRYQQLGKMQDLEKSITSLEQALNLFSTGHSSRPGSLSNLGSALLIRYEQYGKMKDLERSISYSEQALNLFSPGHSGRPGSLSNLGMGLLIRHQQLGKMEDLEDSITYAKQALNLLTANHFGRPTLLGNLGISLLTRYQQLGEMEDLHKSVAYSEQALSLFPANYPIRPRSLSNLGMALLTRYQQLGELEDLKKSIICCEEALKLVSTNHSIRPISVNNLGLAFLIRHEIFKKMEDLEKSIVYSKQGLDLFPSDHSAKHTSLTNLGLALHIKYRELGQMQDMDQAICAFQDALSHMSPDHPSFSHISLNQALLTITAHESNWVPCHNCSHIGQACIFLQSAACHPTSSLLIRFAAAKKWAYIAHKNKHNSAITAYSIALDLQQQHLGLLPSIISQQKAMENSAELSLDAASCAISAGQPEMGVQFLEQGRSILWSKMQGYRQSTDEIAEKAPQLAQQFQSVSHQLEQNAVSENVDVALQRTLSEKWTALLGEIRKLDRFSNYLQATPFKILQTVAAEGPVIMVNISNFQSDALILVSSAPPVIVPLYNVSPEMLEQHLHSHFRPGAKSSKDIIPLLRYLWNTIVRPVVEQLAYLKVPEKSRIWWCPTSYLCALPLHAAGLYTKKSINLPDLYISSYTPTLASLIRARSKYSTPQSAFKLFLVSQPDNTIPRVVDEVKVICSFNKQVVLCPEDSANKESVLAGLQSHPWVHFACHGHLTKQPFESWFQLHNKETLSVLDLARADLPKAEFAFLSACHSAASNIQTPDESIHLAAALQFCGFRSVVGTLWAMGDDDGPKIVKAFYGHMFGKAGIVNLRDAAEALNIATKELRKHNVPLDRWINFIHIGA